MSRESLVAALEEAGLCREDAARVEMLAVQILRVIASVAHPDILADALKVASPEAKAAALLGLLEWATAGAEEGLGDL